MKPQQPVCKRCGAPAGVDDVVTSGRQSDPLQITECARCGSILDVGTHQW